MGKAAVKLHLAIDCHKTQVDTCLHKLDTLASSLYVVGLDKISADIRSEIFTMQNSLKRLYNHKQDQVEGN